MKKHMVDLLYAFILPWEQLTRKPRTVQRPEPIAVDPEQLARAMCFINSNLAREAGRLHGFREKFWSRRYRAIPVTGELAAQIERLRCLLAHSCKEGFVLTPGGWPGVHCIDALLYGKPL